MSTRTSFRLIVCAIGTLGALVVHAADTKDLQNQIDVKSAEIQRLNAEIKATDVLVKGAGKEATSLKKTLANLEASRKSLETQIAQARLQIRATEGTINNLENSIRATTKQLAVRRGMVAETVRLLAEEDATSPVLNFFGYASMGEYWAYEQALEDLQKNLTLRIIEAKQTKTVLDRDKSIQEAERARLTNYSTQVEDKKKIAEATSAEKQSLLKATQSKQEIYQKLLIEKQKEKEAVEAELLAYEAQLTFTLDPTSIPAPGTKVLRWPTDSRTLTQYFGDTAFSRTRAAVYNGKGHNGIDIGISIGTPLYAASDGIVRGFGNTDVSCKGASYGKWILVDHAFNMSTLYAHLSLVSVTEGQKVQVGDLIGYSGNTGYTTGPHLHFSLFAQKGVTITSLQSKVRGCGRYTLPVASFTSYLNPIQYLP